ncbi:MAG: glycosyltransferase family 39 protein [Myxococcales bacterium]|nr:glycosyltransferase family 39 protein [Myxococcales bacterium]
MGCLPFALAILPVFLGIYGRFNDELYFIACSKHLALGYVDQPPLSVWLLALVRAVAGESLLALRIVPACFAFVVALLTGRLAYRLGAGRWGQMTAAFCAGLVLPLNIIYSFYSMNPLSVALWIAATLVLVEIDKRQNPSLWLLFGAVAGLAALNKHPALVFIATIALSYAAFHLRTLFRHKELYLGALLAFAIALPNVIWQVQHDWISLWFYRQGALKNIPTPPLAVLGFQLATMNPGSLLLLAGVFLYFRGERLRRDGWMALACGGIFLLFIFSGQSRPDRIMALYPIGFAAAAAGWESLGSTRASRLLRPAIPALALATFLLLAPAMLPLLPPRQIAAHAARLGIVPKIEKVGRTTPLPQWIADRLGWQDLARRVAAVARTLTPGRRTAVIGSDYGFAGALQLYRRRYGLPPVYGFHNAFHDWGPPPADTEVFLLVGVSESRARRYFRVVRVAARGDCPLCVGDRQHPPIIVARGPRSPIAEMWRRLRMLI